VNRSAAVANRQAQIDVATFIQWVNAHGRAPQCGGPLLSRSLSGRVQVGVRGLLEAKPFENASAPPTPFAMPMYRLKASTEADRLEATAAAASERAKEENQRADNYMLAVVLFASSLFFAGLRSKLGTVRARTWVLGLGFIIFLGTLIWSVTLPVQLTV
jgi:hypothetical protein